VLECSEGGGLLHIPVIEDALDVLLALNRPVRRTQVFTVCQIGTPYETAANVALSLQVLH